jgi:hypothetical protein
MAVRHPRPSAGVFLFVAPLFAVGVDGVVGNESVGGFAQDGRGGGRGGGVVLADAEVVDAAAVAQGEFAELPRRRLLLIG